MGSKRTYKNEKTQKVGPLNGLKAIFLTVKVSYFRDIVRSPKRAEQSNGIKILNKRDLNDCYK